MTHDEDIPLPLPVVVAIRVPDAELRAPRVTADVVIGPVLARFTVQRRRGGRLEIKLPVTRDGEEAFRVQPEMHDRIVEVVTNAVQADREAARYLAAPATLSVAAVAGMR